MAANNQREDTGLRGQASIARRIHDLRNNRPAVEWPKPIVNSVTDALDDTGCRVERLGVLLSEALGELHEISTSLPSDGGELSKITVDRIYNNWIVFEIVGEKVAELDRLITAVTIKAYEDAHAGGSGA